MGLGKVSAPHPCIRAWAVIDEYNEIVIVVIVFLCMIANIDHRQTTDPGRGGCVTLFQCNYPMNPHVRLFVGWSVSLSLFS